MATKIALDATIPEIKLESDSTGGDYSEESAEGSVIKINATEGLVEARNDNGVSQISAAGIFSNNAGTDALPNSAGWIHKAAIVGLGFGNVDKSDWVLNENYSVIAGVYGRASNSGTAPAYGGMFYNLFAGGLTLGRKCITGTAATTTYLSDSDTMIIGYTSSTGTVYLPNTAKEGTVIFVKQWWNGVMRFRARSGQYIYDDTSVNDYYDFGEGQGGMFVFTIGYITSGGTTTKKEAWIVSKWKY